MALQDRSLYKTLLEEALPSVSASTQIFINAPEQTQEILLTIRAKAITLRFDGNTATAAANGHEYGVTAAEPHLLPINQAQALLCMAVEDSGTATGWITYRG